MDTETADESVLRELAGFYDVIDAEELPDDPPTPVEARIAHWRNNTQRFPVPRWILWEDGRIVGCAVAQYDTEENLENAFGRIVVHPESRGRGHLRKLASPLLDHLQEEGRTRFDTWVGRGSPAEALLERVGLRSVYTDRLSRLWVRDLDHGLMEQWIERASERAEGYELLYFPSPVPDEHLERICKLQDVMNTAPLEDYEMDDETTTPENWRDTERAVEASHGRLHNLVAVESATGEFAGYTQIKTQDLHPTLAWQWNTGVDPAHRNKGLGRWLKAAMIEKIAEEYPLVERVDTYNAASNAPMLGINNEMGFKEIHIASAWQGDLAGIRSALNV